MQLRRIEIRDFRKLSHLVVDGLADGLNVLVGDNEAGKSTLLAALRAVLFERHRVGGEVAKAMLPHGQKVRPEVTIDFDLGGAAWRLRKAFNQRPEAELTGPEPRVTGDAVEERMAELLGFQASGTRGSKPDEHQGVYGLLWVDQGQAHAKLNAGAGQGSLATALETEVGQVMGGERGRLLLVEAERRRTLFWDKYGKPKGDYRKLQERIDVLDTEKAVLEDHLRQHDAAVASLTHKTELLARHAREGRLAVAVLRVEEARVGAERAGRLAATVREVGTVLDRARRDRDAAAERLAARQNLVAKVQADEGRSAAVAAEATSARALLGRAEVAERLALDRGGGTRAARTAAEAALARIQKSIARRQACQALDQKRSHLAEAEAEAERQRGARATATAIGLTRKDLADLDGLAASCDQARARRDAASVQISFEPVAGAAVMLDGVEHPAGTPLRLTRDAVLDLAGFGRLTVRPGGGIEPLARAVEAAERALADRLRQSGQPSRDVAVASFARKVEVEAEAVAHGRVVAALAPAGLEALRQDVRTLEAAASAVEPEPDPITEHDLVEARRMVRDAALAEATVEAEAASLRGAREVAARDAAVLDERAAAAARDHLAGVQALAAARAVGPDIVLAERLAVTEHALGLASDAEAQARRALEAADPEIAALALRRAEGAEQAIRADIETLTREKRDIEVELRTLGREGLGEQLAEAEGRLALLRRQAEAQTLEARASLLLYQTLVEAQAETRDRWLGPVRDRVRPYLRLIQPDSEIVLNEKTFAIEHLVRGGVNEPFETLSVGAREQVAVITRLALADILRASGQPTAVILDDALVNTDETRLERMHLVLQKASQSLQVLVLTCRERDFYGLGVPIRRL